MVGEKIAKQMLDLQKATVNQTYNTMLVMQDHSEKLMQTFMEQAVWMPDEGKKAVNGWISAVKKNEVDCKQMIDDYFTSVEQFIVVEKTAKQPAKPAAPKAAASKA